MAITGRKAPLASPPPVRMMRGMDSFSAFIISSSVVLAALITSLVLWIKIRTKTHGAARRGATLFAICFALYVLGQAWALMLGLRVIDGGYMVPSLSYASAAVLFVFGSYQHYQHLRK